ncbi:MAG: hypothetical protein GKR89_05875 [Candidatus Latescibacteria bacterium]|nr:hypothetical protein [Candidatus Latescibacterota bacterium]
MSLSTAWKPAEPDIAAVRSCHADPLGALARADIPAILLRRAYPADHCRGLVQRFLADGLMHDPSVPLEPGQRTRIDIGTSLGNKGSDREQFFAHAAQTRALFTGGLFTGLADPVQLMYRCLAELAPDKDVLVAREPDGRQYGPAIFRIHYDSHAYRPHIDHVSLREKRFDYAVSRFTHQFAGVLCVQNADDQGPGPQALLHRCLWNEQIQPHIEAGNFHAYAQIRRLPSCRVELEPGDLYFFNTQCIHEVPAVAGTQPRIVLAVFIGYAPEDGEIYVWS